MIIHSNQTKLNQFKTNDVNLVSFSHKKSINEKDIVNLFLTWANNNIYRQKEHDFVLQLDGFGFFASRNDAQVKIEDMAYFSPHDKKTYIQGATFREKNPSIFKKDLFKQNITTGEYAILVLFHELGHAVSFKYSSDNNNIFSNFLQPQEQHKKEIIDNLNTLYPAWNTFHQDIFAKTIQETIADTYCIIMCAHFMGMEKGKKISNVLMNVRKSLGDPFYDNEWALEKVNADLKSWSSVKDEFNSFEDLHKYLSKVASYNLAHQIAHHSSLSKSTFANRNMAQNLLLAKTNLYQTEIHNTQLINELSNLKQNNGVLKNQHLPIYQKLVKFCLELKCLHETHEKPVLFDKKMFFHEPHDYQIALGWVQTEINNPVNFSFSTESHLKDKIRELRKEQKTNNRKLKLT